MRHLPWIPSLLVVTALTACGGGGGGSVVNPPPPPPPPPPTQVIASPAPNVLPITVDAGPTVSGPYPVNAINTAYVSVTVCVPGSAAPSSSTPTPTGCQTIDHIEVDTQSVGLRIVASALNSPSTLPLAPAGAPNAACAVFADGTVFGSIRMADVYLPTSDQGASIAYVKNLNVHVIGDPALMGSNPNNTDQTHPPALPASCSNKPENTVAPQTAGGPAFGANGILGVGYFLDDCGAFCNTNSSSGTGTSSGTYYSCTGTASTTSCPGAPATEGSATTQGQQIHNVVALFTSNNNGVIVELPSVGSGGATGSLTGGMLVFGINTSSNNAPGSATVLPADPVHGTLIATYKGAKLATSYLDSGSNATYFNDSAIAACTSTSLTGFYCPTTTVNTSVVFQPGTTATTPTVTVDFSVVDPTSVPAATVALPGLGGKAFDSTTFDGGLTFFFGRNVFSGFEKLNADGPYAAF